MTAYDWALYITTRPGVLKSHSPLFHQAVVIVKYRISILIQHRVLIKSPKHVMCLDGKVTIDHITAKTGILTRAANV